MTRSVKLKKKATFDLDAEVAQKLDELKQRLQYDEGFAASEASAVAIVSAFILTAKPKEVATLLKRVKRRP